MSRENKLHFLGLEKARLGRLLGEHPETQMMLSGEDVQQPHSEHWITLLGQYVQVATDHAAALSEITVAQQGETGPW